MTQKLKWPLTLKTKRLVLRPYRPVDFSAWKAAYLGRQPARNEFDAGPLAAQELTRVFFAGVRTRHADRAARDIGYVLPIFDRRTGEVLGCVDLYVFDRGDSQSANFGYFLHNPHWGHGYAREAAFALAIAAFRDLKIHRLEATIGPRNRPSLKLIRALGFRRLGVRKRSDWRGGKWQDDVVYYATPNDFGLPMKAPTVKRKR